MSATLIADPALDAGSYQVTCWDTATGRVVLGTMSTMVAALSIDVVHTTRCVTCRGNLGARIEQLGAAGS